MCLSDFVDRDNLVRSAESLLVLPPNHHVRSVTHLLRLERHQDVAEALYEERLDVAVDDQVVAHAGDADEGGGADDDNLEVVVVAYALNIVGDTCKQGRWRPVGSGYEEASGVLPGGEEALVGHIPEAEVGESDGDKVRVEGAWSLDGGMVLGRDAGKLLGCKGHLPRRHWEVVRLGHP